MNNAPQAVPNETPRAQALPDLHSSSGTPTSNLQLLSLVARWPTRSIAPPETPAERLAAQSLRQQVLVFRIQEAIIKEKIRLLCNIVSMREHAAHSESTTTSPLLALPQQVQEPDAKRIVDKIGSSPLLALPQQEPDAKRIVNKIGSQIRIGEPYIDVTKLPGITQAEAVAPRPNRGGHTETFPQVSRKKIVSDCCLNSRLTFVHPFQKLHRVLADVQDTKEASIVSFLPHGRALIVHDVERFAKEILPKYFKHRAWPSFTRQLSIYGFRRVNSSPDSGSYYHELFLRDHKGLSIHMRRVGMPQKKQLGDRRIYDDTAPNFYALR
jgi:hypothetical protein